MVHHIKDGKGITHTVEELGWMNGVVYLWVDNSKTISRKMGYRHERTWNDHMGNTPCGYYADVPFSNGEQKRVYLTLCR